MESIVECFRCYYVERKLLALAASVGIILGLYFGLQQTSLDPFLALMLALVCGLVCGNIIYVITSESFCNYCASTNALSRGSVHALA